MKNSTKTEIEKKVMKLSSKVSQLRDINEKISNLQVIRRNLVTGLPSEIVEYLHYGLKVQNRQNPYSESKLKQSKDYNEKLMQEKFQIFRENSDISIEELISFSNIRQDCIYPVEKREILDLDVLLEEIRDINGNSHQSKEQEDPTKGFSASNFFQN